MRNINSIFLALALAFTAPLGGFAADEKADKGEKVAVADLPMVVKDSFAKEAAGGEITSVIKLGGDKPRYQIHYKLEGKEHQITLGADGARTQHKKKDGEAK
jgi:hypothetical protein